MIYSPDPWGYMVSMGAHVRQTIRMGSSTIAAAFPYMRIMGWTAARILFVFCAGLGVTTVVGCYILSPLFCYWFFGSLRFWNYLHLTFPMIRFTYHLAYLSLKGRSVHSLHWTAPPMKGPDLSAVKINPNWTNGDSCGDCGECCRRIKCPFLEKKSAHCLSYDSFYWRYFNCGRYPTSQLEIDLYECPKWLMKR